MRDGAALERAGIPTAVVVTGEFLHEARMQGAALGMEALKPVVITHPLSTLSDEQIAGRAREAAAQAVNIWRGDEAG